MVEDDRKPGLNPLAGDVLERTTAAGAVMRRTVTEVSGKTIVYAAQRNGKDSGGGQCFISTWQEWAAKATVVNKA